MNNDLISRSALLEKAVTVTEYDEGGWGFEFKAVPETDVLQATAVDVDSEYKHSFEMIAAKYAKIQDKMLNGELVEVVRCKDCKHNRERNEYERNYLVDGVLICTSPDATDDCWNAVWGYHFCSYGERRAEQ